MSQLSLRASCVRLISCTWDPSWLAIQHTLTCEVFHKGPHFSMVPDAPGRYTREICQARWARHAQPTAQWVGC